MRGSRANHLKSARAEGGQGHGGSAAWEYGRFSVGRTDTGQPYARHHHHGHRRALARARAGHRRRVSVVRRHDRAEAIAAGSRGPLQRSSRSHDGTRAADARRQSVSQARRQPLGQGRDHARGRRRVSKEEPQRSVHQDRPRSAHGQRFHRQRGGRKRIAAGPSQNEGRPHDGHQQRRQPSSACAGSKPRRSDAKSAPPKHA